MTVRGGGSRVDRDEVGAMLLSEVSALLDCEVSGGASEMQDLEVRAGFAADLMSEVLAFCPARALLVTGLATVQAVHTADLADLCAVIFVNGKRPPRQVADLAAERGIPLLVTRRSMFAACGELYRRGLQPASKS